MNIKAIVKFANSQLQNAPLHERLVDIYSGNLVQYVEQAIAEELSSGSYDVARKRIASINLIERIVNKLSKVYSDVPNRQTSDDSDTEIINQYANEAEIQSVMAQAEVLLNTNKQFALEPYLKDGTFSVRVLAAHEFCLYSDNEQNPKSPTAFIKFMGSKKKTEKKQVNVFWIYTSESFLVADSDGDMLEQQPNPYGVIPFVYASSDTFNLQPKPDIDSFNNAILIPKLLGDLCYSAAFMSRSILFGIDIDTTNLTNAPDVLWNIKSVEGENKKPEIGTIEPKVDIPNVLALISSITAEWLTSKGLKPGSIGSLSPENAASGIAKMVDQADTSIIVSKNRIILSKAETQLWSLIATIHNLFVGSDLLAVKKGLSDNLKVSISFQPQQPIADPSEQRASLKFQLDNKLISYIRALKQQHPNLNDDEILKLKAEIEAESQPTNNQP